MSGLRANHAKSTVYLAGVKEELQIGILNRLGFEKGEFPVKYLGLPLQTRNVRVHEYSHLYDKIGKLIDSWTVRKLSYAGRLQLIKSVFAGIQNFWSQVLILPKDAIDMIESLCKNFLWSGKAEGHKFLVAWADVTKPFCEGGLDIHELLAWNKSLFSKLLGDLVTQKPSIWYRWCLHNHIKEGDVWDMSLRTHETWIWRNIVQVRDDLKLHLGVDGALASGLDAHFSSSGGLSSASIYQILWDKGEEIQWGEVIWGKLQCRKWAFIVWLAARKRMQTGQKVKHWRGLDAAECVLCRNEEETEEHLWFSCPAIRSVKNMVFDWVWISKRFGSIEECLNWFASEPRGVQKKQLYQAKLLVFEALVYFTWKARNGVIFREEQFDATACASTIIGSCRSRISARWKNKHLVDSLGLQRFG